MEEIKKHYLDSTKTISFFIENIKCEKIISQHILRNIDFHGGKFFTLLPSIALKERIYEFPYGGIIPSLPYDDQGNRYVETMDKELALFIKSFVEKTELNCAIAESYMMSYDSDYLHINDVKVIPYEQEVYYLIVNKNSEDEVYATIRACAEVWHFLCVLTKMENKCLNKLHENEIKSIVKNLEYIITSAYDGESYIFWERQIYEG